MTTKAASSLEELDRTKTIWALEDSPEVIATFELLLKPRYDLVLFGDIAAFQAAHAQTAPDRHPAMFIADLLLPDGCFLDVLDSAAWQSTPIAPLLVTSGITDIEPMRRCLQHGAVDYIVKPFVANELLIKVERGLIQGAGKSPGENAVVLDNLSRCVSHAGKTSDPLTSREMQIMSLMRESFDQPIKRADIIKRVWGTTKVTNKCLDVHLSHLRAKVDGVDLEIRLIGGSAYQLVARTAPASGTGAA